MKHNGLYYLDLGKLNKQFTDRVKKDTGINIDGYTLSITSDGKNHFAKHMNRPEIKKITINDLNNLANILSNYDSAKAFSNHSGLNFEFITETNSNYKYITLELVSKGKNNLSLLSLVYFSGLFLIFFMIAVGSSPVKSVMTSAIPSNISFILYLFFLFQIINS